MISWRHLWETLTTCKPYYHFPDKELHGTYSLNGDHQQRSRRRTAAYCPGEVSPNLYSSSGISHQIESGPRRTATAEEHHDRCPEDVLSAREEKPKKRERQEDTQQDRGRKMARTGERRDDRRSKPSASRFTSFTPLTTPIDQVLMQIKDEGALTFPSNLEGDPNKWSRDKYCRFYRDHKHDTADCYNLKQQTEALIRQGKLQKFVNRESRPAPRAGSPTR